MTFRSLWIPALAFVWSAQLLAGCATYATNVEGRREASLSESEAVLGQIGEKGYALKRFPVGFALRDGGVAPSQAWLLENVRDAATTTYRSKVGDRFVQVLLLDTDGSGVSTVRQHVPRYELYFRHATTGAALTFRAHALSEWAKYLDLAVLAMERVDAEASTLSTVVADGSGVAVVNESDARVAESRGGTPVVVANLPAYAFEYRVRDGNRMRLGLPEQPIRVRSVFVRANFMWEMDYDTLPVVLEFTLAARGVHFEQLQDALNDLVSRFRAPGPELVKPEVRRGVDSCFPAGQPPDRLDVRAAFVANSMSPRPVGFAVEGAEFSEPTLVDCLREAVRDAGGFRAGITRLHLRLPPPIVGARAYAPEIWDTLAPEPGATPPPQVQPIP